MLYRCEVRYASIASGDGTETALGDPDQSTLNPDPRVHTEGQAL